MLKLVLETAKYAVQMMGVITEVPFQTGLIYLSEMRLYEAVQYMNKRLVSDW